MKVKQAVISCFSVATHLSLHTHTDLVITAPDGNDEMREAGGNFSFNCTAEVLGNASGAVDFFWKRRGVRVSNTSTLTLNSITQDSTGVYTCVAVTSFLTRSANLTLTVIGQYQEWVHEWRASVECSGWRASVECSGWRASAECSGWRASVECSGWRASVECSGWRASAE